MMQDSILFYNDFRKPMEIFLNDVVNSGLSSTIQISDSCNPNWKGISHSRRDCSVITSSDCKLMKEQYLGGVIAEATKLGDFDGEPVWETMFNCPICGCGSNNFNNLWQEHGARFELGLIFNGMSAEHSEFYG